MNGSTGNQNVPLSRTGTTGGWGNAPCLLIQVHCDGGETRKSVSSSRSSPRPPLICISPFRKSVDKVTTNNQRWKSEGINVNLCSRNSFLFCFSSLEWPSASALWQKLQSHMVWAQRRSLVFSLKLRFYGFYEGRRPWWLNCVRFHVFDPSSCCAASDSKLSEQNEADCDGTEQRPTWAQLHRSHGAHQTWPFTPTVAPRGLYGLVLCKTHQTVRLTHYTETSL